MASPVLLHFSDNPGRCRKRAARVCALAALAAVGFRLLLAPAPGVAAEGDIQLLQTYTAGERSKKLFAEIGGVHLDPDGTLYVTDTASGALVVFTPSAQQAHRLAGKEQVFRSGKLAGIARLDDGTLAIANSGDDVIAALDRERHARYLIGEPGSNEGRLDGPAGLAVSARGRLYAAERGNDRVSVFARDGLFLFVLGQHLPESGRLSAPIQVAVDAEERVYVLEDKEGGRISIYSHVGEFLQRLTPEQFKGYAERTPRFSAIAVDAQGQLYAADRNNGKILQLDWKNAKPALAFGSKGAGRGQFAEITAMTVTAERRLVVGDSGNLKIEIYQLPPVAAPAADGPKLPLVARGPAIAAGENAPACDTAYPLPGGAMLCLQRGKKTVLRVGADGKAETFGGPYDEPRLAAVDEKTVAIVDGDRVRLLGHDAKPQFVIGRSGVRDGEFDAPGGICLGDRIYVADTGNSRIQIFSRDGVYLAKIANTKERAVLKQPVALALDSQNNLYVADNGANRIRVFSPERQLLYELGEGESAPHRFRQIHDLALDQDDNLYVLAATAVNDNSVRIYSGPRLLFAFGAQLERGVGMTRAATLTLLESEKAALAVYDSGRRRLQTYNYLQVPAQVGGLIVHGGPQQTALRWGKAPGSFIERYRVYGAREAKGPYELLLETKQNTAALTPAPGKDYLFYRVGAVSNNDVEGAPSLERLDRFLAGYRRFQEQRYAEAAEILAQAQQETPNNGHALEYLGRSRLEQGRVDETLALAQDLAKITGFEAVAVNLQVEALLRGRQLLPARALLDKARAERRGDAQSLVLCGRLNLLLNDAVGAVDCLEKAVKQGKTGEETHFLLGQAYVRLGAVQRGLAEFDKAVRLAPASAASWVQSGLAYQALNMHKEAIERFEKALALDDLNAGARLGAAQSHIALKNHDKAHSIAISMSGSPEQEAAGQYLLGVIALAKKQYQDAALALTRAGAKDPANVSIWIALADAQTALKNPSGTIDALRQATKADPDSFDANHRLARLLQDDGRHADAAPLFERAVALRPGHYEARYAFALALAASDRLKDASLQAGEAAKLAPKQTDPILLLADIAHRQGKHGEAIGHLTRLLKLRPASAEAQLKLGTVYLETNAYDQAQPHLEKAALLGPTNSRPHELLGAMYLERRLFDQAIRALARAAELNPSQENTMQLNAAYAEKKKSLEFKQTAPRIVLQDLKLKRVFSAAYKQYATEPLGSVKLKNVGPAEYSGLKLSFHIKGYMDFPGTMDLPALKAGTTLEVPLTAVFNNKILGIDEDTGVQVEVKLAYFQDGRQDTVEITRPMTIYGKNAILWSSPLLVGSFITPKDETLKDFVRQGVGQFPQEETALNRNLVTAMIMFDLMSAHGIRYLVDPNTPYSRLGADQVDYVQFPRETLRLKTGDCDDLSVLLSAALENLGLETALVDIPGHLFLMFNTGLPAKNRDLISLQNDLLVLRNGEVWVPLEATMIATSFSEAWTEGAKKYREAETTGRLKLLPVKDAWARHMPVTLAPANFTLEPPATERVRARIERERSILLTKSLDRLVRPYRAMAQNSPADQEARIQIAILYAKNGLHDLALKELDQILEAEPTNSAAHNSRGNIYYNLNDYDRALEAYRYAGQLDPTDGGIKLNMALAYYRQGKIKEAVESFNEAVTLNRDLENQYKSLKNLLGS